MIINNKEGWIQFGNSKYTLPSGKFIIEPKNTERRLVSKPLDIYLVDSERYGGCHRYIYEISPRKLNISYKKRIITISAPWLYFGFVKSSHSQREESYVYANNRQNYSHVTRFFPNTDYEICWGRLPRSKNKDIITRHLEDISLFLSTDFNDDMGSWDEILNEYCDIDVVDLVSLSPEALCNKISLNYSYTMKNILPLKEYVTSYFTKWTQPIKLKKVATKKVTRKETI